MSSKISIARMRRNNRQLRKDVRLLKSDEQHLTLESYQLEKKYELLEKKYEQLEKKHEQLNECHNKLCKSLDRNHKVKMLALGFLFDINSAQIKASGLFTYFFELESR